MIDLNCFWFVVVILQISKTKQTYALSFRPYLNFITVSAHANGHNDEKRLFTCISSAPPPPGEARRRRSVNL